MRYVTLKKHYWLRGWRDREFALYNWKAWSGEYGKALPLTRMQKEAIELLTRPGVSIDDPLLPQGMRQAGEKLLTLGFLEERAPEADLAEEQKYRFADTLMSHSITWSITGDCNLRCRHCYISCDENVYGEPTMAQCEEIVRQMKDANIHMVDLTGGEPLVRRDFWDLVDMLMDEKIYIEEIFSNGLLITDSFLDKLERRKIKLNSFLLSFDGVGRHDWMRGLHGAEEATIRTIKRLKSRGYGVIVTTVLHEQSMDCLMDTYQLMKDLDVDYWRVADVVNTGNWKKTQNTEVRASALLDAYVDLIGQMKRDGMPFRAVKLAGCFHASGDSYTLPALGGCGTKAQENEHLCEASKLFPHLLPDGRLLPCMPMCGTEMEEHAPNILSGEYDIAKALIDSPLGKYMQYTYRDVFLHEEECRSCPHKYKCNRCPATSLLYGSLFAKSPLTCAFIKRNYADRIRDVMDRAG